MALVIDKLIMGLTKMRHYNMVVLTEKQIKYGFDYYHKDETQLKSVVEVSEYEGEDRLMINFYRAYVLHKNAPEFI